MTKIRAKSNRNIVDVHPRRAEALVRAGIFEYVETDAQRARKTRREERKAEKVQVQRVEQDFESKTVAELRELAGDMEIEGTGASGNVLKADLIRALSRRYQRRDLRAED